MKPTPSSFPEALRLLEEVAESVQRLQRFFGAANMPTKPVASEAAHIEAQPPKSLPKERLNLKQVVSTNPAGSVSERVLQIVRESSGPISPKEVQDEWVKRGWENPKRGSLYNLINGTLAYLHKRRGVLERPEAGVYVLHLDQSP